VTAALLSLLQNSPRSKNQITLSRLILSEKNNFKMPLSLYDITIPPFIRSLKALSAFLEKGRLHASSDERALLDSRLIADMEALPYQIQRISDTARGCAVRVAKTEPVPMEDNEKTFAELQERITKTIQVLEKVDPKSMDGMEEVKVTVGKRELTAQSYVLGFAVPNFYFHVSIAYAILRKEGAPIGKMDYLGVA
jgi:uncharacterized protein